MRLPVRCEPYPGVESLGGFVRRAAHANGYDTTSWLLEAAGLPRSFASVRCCLGGLAALTGADRQLLERTAIWSPPGVVGRVTFGNALMYASHVNFGTHRFCPGCLEEACMLQRNWQLRPVVACDRHGLLLLDKCPACSRWFSPRTRCLRVCRCGYRTARGDTPAAGCDAVGVAGLIRRLSEGGEAGPGLAPVTTLNGALSLVWFFGSCTVDQGEEGWRSRHMSKPTVSSATRLLPAAWAVLSDWPAGLHRWLDGRRRGGAGHVGLTAEFGPWLHRLSSAASGGGCDAVTAEAKSWLATSWGRGTLKPGSCFYTAAQKGGPLNAAQAAQLLGVSGSTVARMLAEGDLAGEVLPMGGRRAMRVNRRSVADMLKGPETTRSLHEVGIALGISAPQVETLRNAGLLSSRSVLVAGRRVRRLTPEGMTSLVAGLAAVASSKPPSDDGGLLPLSALPSRRQVRLDVVMRSILDRSVPCWADKGASGPFLKRFRVRLADVAGRVPGSRAALSVREAATRLGISTRMMPALVDAGCLRVITRPSGSEAPAKRNLCQTSVKDFGSKYVMSRELAHLDGTSTRAVVSSLAARGIVPVVAPDTKQGISGVWRRADVSRPALLLPGRDA